MIKLDRLLSIVLMLHSKRLLRAQDLSEHFGVSLRTIYRDINTLCDAGVPIAAEAGVGYSLVKGYTLPPVMFSNEEASSIVIAAEFLSKMSANKELTQQSARAVAKVLSILPEELKERIHLLQNTTAVFRPQQAQEPSLQIPTIFSDMQLAIAERRCVDIEYRTAGLASSHRRIEPLGMVFYGNYWHCIAYCQLREAIRDFRTDRVTHLELSDTRFAPHLDFNILDFLNHQYSSESPITVRVVFDAQVAPFVGNKHYFGFVKEELRDDGIEMTFFTPSLRYISRWLFSYADHIRIIEPTELSDRLRKLAVSVLSRLDSNC